MDMNSLIPQIRSEGNDVKGCFTDFSFKAMTLSATALALMFAALGRIEMVDFAAIPVIGLLYTVARIGIYKYSTSNRQFGYQLHLARTVGVDHKDGAWEPHMRTIDWEEALRAWRVVQPALFREIYQTGEKWPANRLGHFLRKYHLTKWLNDRNPFHYSLSKRAREVIEKFSPGDNAKEYPWFHLPTLTRSPSEKGYSYHAGSYLKNMTRMLFTMKVLLLLPMAYMTITRLFGLNSVPPAEQGDERFLSIVLGIRVATLLVLIVLISLFFCKITLHRLIIEEGVLSIHSAAITWQAVVLAHYRTVQRNAVANQRVYHHYTESLVLEAKSLADNAFRVHEWVTEKPKGWVSRPPDAEPAGEADV